MTTNADKYINEGNSPIIIDPAYTSDDLMYIPIGISGTSNEIIEGVEGKSINIMGMMLVTASDVTMQLYAGDTGITGEMSIGENSGFILTPSASIPYLKAPDGESLNLILSSGVEVGGFAIYYVE